tara:strand:- start:32 stop:469 length:438 start_codon:yes stop_codon:yes gene_type:complete
MRFEVPQFIEVEDKIFGPFTWKQFIYLMGGGGIALVLFLTTPFIVFVLLGLPIGSLAILLAFYPVNNRPFSIYLESMLRFVSGTKLYLWRKQTSAVYGEESPAVPSDLDQEIAASVAQNMHVPTVNKNHLSSLSRNLELNAIEKQ